MIKAIDGEVNANDQFWATVLNSQFIEGGCQQQVHAVDNVLFAFNGFNKTHFLNLEGPTEATVNKPVTLTVLDGATNNHIEGATVNDQTSDVNGQVSLVFASAGAETVNAERDDSVRSNGVTIQVSA